MSQAHHVLILGCGRSGTSIFGELFAQVEGYTYLSEPDYDQLHQLDYRQPSAVKVPRESAAFPPDKGLSFPLQDWLALVPEPKTIFWQVRHPLDTICSLRVGISRNWGHHPQPPDWRKWLDKPLLEQCAYHWLYINTIGFASVKDYAILNRYEEMLLDKSSWLQNIAKQLGWDSAQLQHAQAWSQRVQNTHNQQYQEAETSSAYSTKDHRVKVGRWQENLSQQEADMLWERVKDVAEGFGYEYR